MEGRESTQVEHEMRNVYRTIVSDVQDVKSVLSACVKYLPSQ